MRTIANKNDKTLVPCFDKVNYCPSRATTKCAPGKFVFVLNYLLGGRRHAIFHTF